MTGSRKTTESPITTGAYIHSTQAFFTPTKLFNAQITALFDHTWSTYTSLRYLRTQVKNHIEQFPMASNYDIRQNFVDKADKNNHANLYRSFVMEAWEQQEQLIIKNLLINVFAHYEAWCENIIEILGGNPSEECAYLQYVYRTNKNWHTIYDKVIDKTQTTITKAFYETYKKSSRYYNFSLMDNWILYLRYYKECRNSYVHKGNIITQEMLNMYNTIKNFTEKDLDTKTIPLSPIPSDGKNTFTLSLRHVIGFTEILLKVVNTFDIEFIQTKQAQDFFIQFIKENRIKEFPTNLQALDKNIRTIVRGAYFKTPDSTYNRELYTLLKSNAIMR